jgi:hypothetical protein
MALEEVTPGVDAGLQPLDSCPYRKLIRLALTAIVGLAAKARS